MLAIAVVVVAAACESTEVSSSSMQRSQMKINEDNDRLGVRNPDGP
jgi:hypothetical protein